MECLNNWSKKTTSFKMSIWYPNIHKVPMVKESLFLDPSEKTDLSNKFVSLNRHKPRRRHQVFSIPSVLWTRHCQDTAGKASLFFSKYFQV